MKSAYIFIFLFLLSPLFTSAQENRFLKNIIDYDFRAITFTKGQRSSIDSVYTELQSIGLRKNEIQKKVRNYIKSFLTKEQLETIEEVRKDSWINRIIRGYNYLNLDENQKSNTKKYFVEVGDSISLEIKEKVQQFVLENLNGSQLSIKKEKERNNLIHSRKRAEEGDEDYKDKAKTEQKKLKILEDFYYPKLLKYKKSLSKDFSAEDLLLLSDIISLYVEHVETVRRINGNHLIDDSLRVIAPFHWSYHQAKMDRFSTKPDLCIYWCIYYYNREIKRHEEARVIDGLTYLSEKYEKPIKKQMKKVNRINKRLKRKYKKVEGTPKKRKGTTLTIVPTPEIEKVEKIAALLLTR